jgi:hypothetical protein
MAQKVRRIQLLAQFSGGKPTAVKALFSILRSSVEVSNVVKMVNYVNHELSGEHWLAGSDVWVTLGDVGINTHTSKAFSKLPSTSCILLLKPPRF